MTHNSNLFVCALFEDTPYLVDISEPVPQKYPFASAPKRPVLPGAEEGEIDEKRAAADAKHLTTVAVFSGSGDHVITGTNKGWANIISTKTREPIYSTRITSGCVTYIRLTSSGRNMVINSSDRVLRSIHIPDTLREGVNGNDIKLEVEHKFQDVVNRLLWNHCTFSGNGDYLTATTFKNHDIYIWERSMGSLVKILEGPKEEMGVVEVATFFSVVAKMTNIDTQPISGTQPGLSLPQPALNPEKYLFGLHPTLSAGLHSLQISEN